MGVWTIAADAGTGGSRVAASLAEAAGASLLDRKSLAPFARAASPDVASLGDFDDLAERMGGRLNLVALSIAITAGSVDAARELQLRRTLPDLGRAVMVEAAREPCVILAPAAFAALAEHPSAVHVRLHAPLEWRIGACQRSDVLDRRHAEKVVRHDDHVTHAWVRSLYGRELDDASQFSLSLDASRFSQDRLVEIMLAAGGVRVAEGMETGSVQ